MAQARKGQSGKIDERNPFAESHQTAWAKLIGLNAKAAADTNDADYYEKMCNGITLCLTMGFDEALYDAVKYAGDEPDPSELLIEAIRAQATTYSDEDHGQSGFFETDLIAIPIMWGVMGDESHAVPASLDARARKWLAASFRKEGLIDPGADKVLVLPELWSAEQLYDCPYPNIFHLVRTCHQYFAGQNMPDAVAVLDRNPQAVTAEAGHVALYLRFVVCAVRHPIGGRVFLLEDESLDAREQWRATVSEHLQERFRAPIMMFEPDTLYSALNYGWKDYHLMVHAWHREQLFEMTGVLPTEVIAVISRHATDGKITQIRTGFYRATKKGPKLIGGNIWPLTPFDTPETVIALVVDRLRQKWIGRIDLAQQILEEAPGTDQAEPKFVLPNANAIPEDMILSKNRKHLH